MKFPRIANPLFAASLVIVSLTAFAEPSAMSTDNEVAPEWTKADSNRDGFLTKDELVAFPNLVHHFDQIDTDGDTRISQAEYSAWVDGNHRKE